MKNLPYELRLLEEERLFRLENPHFSLDSFLFDKQLAFVRDPAPFKTAVCSRRSGKTVACAADLIATAVGCSEVVCLYITTTRANAKRIIWPELQRLNRTYGFQAHEDLTDLSLRFKNGAVLYLSGAKDASEIEKFRGLAIKKCYIDEVASFRSHIQDLIDDILAPALMDHAGSLCLIGTPGPIPSGYFHQCAVESDTWSKHAWTFFDNPFIESKSGQSHQALLQRELTRRGVTPEDPSIQREWFGRWSLDLDSLLLHYNEEKNHFNELPIAKWDYIMGIDLGFVDADAIAVLAWSDSHPCTFLVEELVQSKQGLTELVQNIERIRLKYEISKMVIDEGGLGKKIAEELRRRHLVPVQPADKLRKMENVAFLNDALRTGRFKAKKNSRFAQDSFLVEIDREKTTPDRIRVKDTYHSDIIDAVLYAFKESPAFTYQTPKPIHKIGSKEWAEEQTEDMWRNSVQQAQTKETLINPWKDLEQGWNS